MDWLIRQARISGFATPMDVAVAQGRIVAVSDHIAGDAPVIEADGRVLVPGLVETHIHLDKTCILDRCPAAEGSVSEAVRLTSSAKRDFTPADVYDRGRRTLERSISWGTTRMRTHVEVDPGIGMRGFEGVQQLQRDYAWAVDLQICVFPQEGLLNNPGTDALLVEGLRRGAQVIGGRPLLRYRPAGADRPGV